MPQGFRIRIGLGIKVAAFVALLLMISTVSLVYLSNRLFVADNTALIQQMNADAAAAIAQQMRDYFENRSQQMRQLGGVMLDHKASRRSRSKKAQYQRRVNSFFTENPNVLGLYVFNHQGRRGRIQTFVLSKALKRKGEKGSATIARLRSSAKFSFSFDGLHQGESQVTVAKLPDQSSALAVGIPFIRERRSESRFAYSLVALLHPEKLSKAFGADDLITRFIVDRQGTLLAHPDKEKVAQFSSVANLEIVQKFLEGKFSNSQTRYVSPDSGEAKLGAFRNVGFGGLGVIAEVPEEKAFEAARRVQYRASLVGIIILCLSLFFGYLFSESITARINVLVEAAKKISEGNFSLNLKPKSKDEVGYLSLSFNEMAKGLAEREKLRDTFNKFHSEEIAAKILSGEVKLGGERMQATVFFSDIRNFTTLSESMAPEKVVELLNEYMERMVKVIHEFNGVVEKYIGDAIMATWGVPIAHSEDSFRAVSASLAMRKELNDLNAARVARGEVPLVIGMGLNSGPVTAGNIGSEQRMEYTVIGDTVNVASRVEAMTKVHGTDLLIAKSVFDTVSPMFICDPVKATHVKGKTEAVEIYKVKGYYGRDKKPVIIETPYSSYTPESSDKVKAA